MTTQQEQQQALSIVKQLHSNLLISLVHTKVIASMSANDEVPDIIDFSKVKSIKTYLGLIYFSGMNEDYFGNADFETTLQVFTEVYPEAEMDQLVINTFKSL